MNRRPLSSAPGLAHLRNHRPTTAHPCYGVRAAKTGANR